VNENYPKMYKIIVLSSHALPRKECIFCPKSFFCKKQQIGHTKPALAAKLEIFLIAFLYCIKQWIN
jgi:hypothetical protein